MARDLDTRSLLLFEAQKKSAGIAYFLWLFLGFFGGHRFYAGKIGSGISLAVLTLFAIATIHAPFLFIASSIWVLVDAFLIPRWVRSHNEKIVELLLGPVPEPETRRDQAPPPLPRPARPTHSNSRTNEGLEQGLALIIFVLLAAALGVLFVRMIDVNDGSGSVARREAATPKSVNDSGWQTAVTPDCRNASAKASPCQ